MLHGGSIKIFPSWVPDTTIIDIRWDDATLSDPLPADMWAGDLALLAGTSSNEGVWEWDVASSRLDLWVPNPSDTSVRRLVAVLEQFTFPLTTGMTGVGELGPFIAPGDDLKFDWEGFQTG